MHQDSFYLPRQIAAAMASAALGISLTLGGCNSGGGSGGSGDDNNMPPVTDEGPTIPVTTPDGGDDTSAWRVREIRYDLDNNGEVDAVRVFSYDVDGHLRAEQYTYSGDGAPDTDFESFSIDAPTYDQTDTFDYDGNGRLSDWATDTLQSRVEVRYGYRSDGQIETNTMHLFDSDGAQTADILFVLQYNGARMTGWEHRSGDASTLYQSDAIAYDNAGVVQSDVLTNALSSAQTQTQYSFSASGKIASVQQTNLAPGSTFFSHHAYDYDSHDRIATMVATGSSADDAYTWQFVRDADGLLSERRIDLDSDGSVESVETYEWEQGACRRVFFWAPRAHPNFVASATVPYIPGTGYGVLPVCAD